MNSEGEQVPMSSPRSKIPTPGKLFEQFQNKRKSVDASNYADNSPPTRIPALPPIRLASQNALIPENHAFPSPGVNLRFHGLANNDTRAIFRNSSASKMFSTPRNHIRDDEKAVELQPPMTSIQPSPRIQKLTGRKRLPPKRQQNYIPDQQATMALSQLRSTKNPSSDNQLSANPVFPSFDLKTLEMAMKCRISLHQLFMQYSTPTPESLTHREASTEQSSSDQPSPLVAPRQLTAGVGWQKVSPVAPKPKSNSQDPSSLRRDSNAGEAQPARILGIRSLLSMCLKFGLYAPTSSDVLLPLPPPLPQQISPSSYVALMDSKGPISRGDSNSAISKFAGGGSSIAPPLSLKSLLDTALISASIRFSFPNTTSHRNINSDYDLDELALEGIDGPGKHIEAMAEPKNKDNAWADVVGQAGSHWYLTFFDFCHFLIRLSMQCVRTSALVPALYSRSLDDTASSGISHAKQVESVMEQANQAALRILHCVGFPITLLSKAEQTKRSLANGSMHTQFHSFDSQHNKQRSVQSYNSHEVLTSADAVSCETTKGCICLQTNCVEVQLAYLLGHWLKISVDDYEDRLEVPYVTGDRLYAREKSNPIHAKRRKDETREVKDVVNKSSKEKANSVGSPTPSVQKSTRTRESIPLAVSDVVLPETPAYPSTLSGNGGNSFSFFPGTDQYALPPLPPGIAVGSTKPNNQSTSNISQLKQGRSGVSRLEAESDSEELSSLEKELKAIDNRLDLRKHW